MYITIVGTGKVASHLAMALEQKGHTILEVYGRDGQKAKKLAKNLYQAEPQDHLDFSHSRATLFLVAVADDAVEMVAEEIVLPDEAVIAHTSGTVPMDVLEKTATEHFGVFYPLQTFSSNSQVQWESVPILLDSASALATNTLEKIGKSLSRNVVPMSSEDRKQIHLAAVFANNFTNYILGAAERVLAEKQIDRRILEPLVNETVRKFLKQGAALSQTGPAMRGDQATIDAHLALLEDMPELRLLYTVVTQQIKDEFADE